MTASRADSGRLIVLSLVLAVALTGVFGRDMWTPDEHRVTAISIEMAESGDLVIPRLAGVPFLQKPPLYFIVAAGAIGLVGESMPVAGAVRLTSVLWGFGVLLLTWFTTRRLTARASAAWASVLVLGTGLGFVENQHWIRVDAALAFFVMAAVWAFTEAYAGGRRWMVATGGLFLAGAFLSKGPIGPLLVFPAWLALLWFYVFRDRLHGGWRGLSAAAHALSGLLFVAVSGVWVALLRSVGGAELWRIWFWENQVGRTTGETVYLGHVHEGEPLYYVMYAALFALPWTPLVAVWLWRRGRDLVAGRKLAAFEGVLLFWSIASLVLLTVPATKRSVYLLPVLPAFAAIAALGAMEVKTRWTRRYFVGWCWVAIGLLMVLGFSPLWAGFLAAEMRPEALGLLAEWSRLQTSMLLLAVLGLALTVFRLRDDLERTAAVTAILWLGLWLFPARVIDLQKTLRPEVEAFVEAVPAQSWRRIAGWNVSETMRGCLVVYGGIAVRNVETPQEIAAILDGSDPDFEWVLVTGRSKMEALDGLEWKVVAEGRPGSRQLRLLSGQAPTDR